MTTAVNTQSINFSSSDPAPIGIFDSGVGGLSVYLHLKQQMPNESYLYYADTLNVPYGSRSSTEIKDLTLLAVDWLVASGCKLVVIACNSASAYGLQLARQKYPNVPIVGLVPALKPAVLSSNSKSVAVLATKATLDGELLNTVIKDYAYPAQVNVVKWFNPNLVPWVEAGMPLDCETPKQLKAQLKHFYEQKVDHLVLGCTHYPFFRDFVLAEVANENLDIKVLDSGAAIAARVKALLTQSKSLVSSKLTNGSKNDLYVGYTSAYNPTYSFNPNHSKSSALIQSIALDTIENKTPSLNPYQDLLQIQNETQDIDHTIKACKNDENLTPLHAGLSFFVSDPKANLAEVSRMVQRLIFRKSL
ncbi:glutamate racemase [Psychrobacter sp.]|uniref:glutamate racemase n=1 Tax=Psychrobacter sp. TaxID=56811 RepID=UPI0025F0E309|nr:glutamate racemase [Psychrobacter sp.]